MPAPYPLYALPYPSYFTWWLAIVGTSAALEVAIVILCSCFSVFPQFYQFWKAGKKRNPKRSGYEYGYGQGPSYGSMQRSNNLNGARRVGLW